MNIHTTFFIPQSMEPIEQAKYIDHFLKELYNSSFPTSLAMGIEMNQIPSKENKQKFKTLEYILEELDLVELVRGRDNSSLGGQCEYFISFKGRELVEGNESSLMLLMQRHIKNNPFFDEKELDKYEDKILEKRANEADFFLDMIIERKLINLDKASLRRHFKTWFKENQEFDLQIKDGDFAIEDGDLQTIPDFSKENIPEFLKWFKKEGNNFIDYLEGQGVNVKEGSKQEIVNNGNLIVNNDSKITEQSINQEGKVKESKWSKASIIATITATIIALVSLILAFNG